MAQKKDPNMKELTKEAILEKNNAGGYVMNKRYRQLFGKREYLYNAMDEYAKQEAIEFAEWIWHLPAGKYTDKKYTTEQLYNLYSQQDKQ